ncbi:hypothetical protein BDQ12DRAFT_691208 [Crucibulum laeve]|uniref:Secreted protein n=1 Tax=Crucibulum laeve TaxID=68775 RepID=A0A5C3LLJ5_9AGAR|nr:hypothetical protein BDQ12DRAFT_691208 [Crucibulum laeve]
MVGSFALARVCLFSLKLCAGLESAVWRSLKLCFFLATLNISKPQTPDIAPADHEICRIAARARRRSSFEIRVEMQTHCRSEIGQTHTTPRAPMHSSLPFTPLSDFGGIW